MRIYSRASGRRVPLRVTAGVVAAIGFGSVWAAAPGLAAAQEPVPAQGEVAGRVVDADSGAPLSGAVVVLEPAPAGLLMTNNGGSTFSASSITVETDGTGSYRFGGLGSGSYAIRVERLGYQPARIEFELHGAAVSRVTLGLVVEPIALSPVTVAVQESPILDRPALSEQVDARRLRSVEERQERFLASDVRSVGYTDMLEAVTLGETDIFRALQRLPGVSTRDDYTAQLWTRGAPWGQTRVYYDGVPLFNPVHLGGVLSGVAPEAVGTVFFHPGVRPVSIGEGAAGVISLSSRTARDHESIPLKSEITLTSIRATSEARFREGDVGVLVSARRSWWDWATEAAADGTAPPTEVVGFALISWSGVADYSWDDSNRVEFSTLYEEDQLDGGIPGTIDGNFGRWGNHVNRLSWDTRLLERPLRFTLGNGRYRADMRDEARYRRGNDPDPDVITLATAFGSIDQSFLRAELSSARVGARPPRWTLGAEWAGHRSRQSGAAIPVAAVGMARDVLTRGSLDYGTLYGEYLLDLHPALAIQAGVRWEMGGRVVNGGRDRVAPRVSSRFQVTPRIAISAAYGRSYQYTQAIGEVGDEIGPGLHFSQTWLLAGPHSPAIRSDVATLGVESWIAGGWLASATGYVRDATGVAIPEPRTGVQFPPGWPGVEPIAAWVEARNEAFGVEVSVRRLVGRITGSASYSYGDSRLRTEGIEFPSPADRRHSVDASVMLRAKENLLVGAAFTGASGAPYTRTFTEHCHRPPLSDGSCPPPATGPIPHRGPVNAERGAVYASLDLMADWTQVRKDWSWGVFVQVRNVLGRDNPGVYRDTICLEYRYEGGRCSPDDVQRDRFEEGIFFPLPLFGFHVAF